MDRQCRAMVLAAAVGIHQVVLQVRKSLLKVWRPWRTPHILVGTGGTVEDISGHQAIKVLKRLESGAIDIQARAGAGDNESH